MLNDCILWNVTAWPKQTFTLQLLEEVASKHFGDKVNREPFHQRAGVEQVEQSLRVEVWKAWMQDALYFPEDCTSVGGEVAQLSQSHDVPGHLTGAIVICSIHKTLCNGVQHSRGKDVPPAKELDDFGDCLWVGGEGHRRNVLLHRIHEVMITVAEVREGTKHSSEFLISEMGNVSNSLLAQVDHKRHGLFLIQGHQSAEYPTDSSRIHARAYRQSLGMHGIQ